MSGYKLRDKVVIDVGDTLLGNLGYQYFPGSSHFTFRAMATKMTADCLVLGVTDQCEAFFNNLTTILRDPGHPHAVLFNRVISGNGWYPIEFGKGFHMATEALINRMNTLPKQNPNYAATVRYIEQYLFEDNPDFGYVCNPFVIKLLQCKLWEEAHALIEEQL